MAKKYNQVFVRDVETMVEIKPEFLYLTIPADYVCTYHKLLVYLADFGKKLLDDCSVACKGNNKTIIDCWNLFQSALASKAIGQDKQADLFINYINKQLDNIYRGEDKNVYNGTHYFPITPDGKLKALCSCGPNSTFAVDVETGELYEQYLKSKDNGAAFVIEGENLKVESPNKV